MVNNHQYKKKPLLSAFSEWKIHGQKAAGMAEHFTKCAGGQGGWQVIHSLQLRRPRKNVVEVEDKISVVAKTKTPENEDLRADTRTYRKRSSFPYFTFCAKRRPPKTKTSENEVPWKRRPKTQDSKTQISETKDPTFFFPLFFFSCNNRKS